MDAFKAAIETYISNFRRVELPPLVISGVYDLYPTSARGTVACEYVWPDTWPNSERAGVYAFFDEGADLMYVGKCSMNSFLGARLGAYFGYGDERQCILKGGPWGRNPRFVMTVGVPDTMTWEAPALEEFLIQQLNPPLNRHGRTTT